MTQRSSLLQKITAHAKAYGFLYPSSEIYEGLQAVYDYGPYGVMLKRNVQGFWWKSMVQLHQDIVGLEAAILMNPLTWQASGHVEAFHDWMVDHKVSKKRYRVDVLVEAEVERLRGVGGREKGERLLADMAHFMERQDGVGLMQLLTGAGIQCPIAKTSDWTQARQFNLMFSTVIGTTERASTRAYLRPETAQGVFVNFLNVQKATRKKMPFGIAQIGKAFRNEIVARQFIFRMREFEQMEMQWFIHPDKQDYWFGYWKAERLKWYEVLGFDEEDLNIHPHDQLAHYAKAAIDIEYNFPFGYKEVEGIHARGDFDLANHQKLSGKKLTYFDSLTNMSYLPHVIEASAGCDRIVLMLLCKAFKQERRVKGTLRTYLQLPPALAPIQAAILPLMKKDELVAVANKLFDTLKYDFSLEYDQASSIGKRYARQDLIGTPYCLTIDYQTLQDNTLTVRSRDTMEQHRLAISQVGTFLSQHTSIMTLLKKQTLN